MLVESMHRAAKRACLAACLLFSGCAQQAHETSHALPPSVARNADATSRHDAFPDADYSGHVTALRARLDARGLGDVAIRVEPPFVVVADAAPEVLAERARTVRWASDRLEQDFFDRRPDRILDIFLFRDAESYEAGVRALTGEPPTTPFGFYSRPDGALFMDISTGGGTLVHEIVHPYVEADLPDAPPWIDEGLGSLFEQCVERDGHIVGLTNWRLAQLQSAIRDGTLPTLGALTRLTDEQFCSDSRGINYAQARYLLYYLQERGLLVPFYRAFRAAVGTDPTGYATLVATLAESDMAEFELRWQSWVETRHFP